MSEARYSRIHWIAPTTVLVSLLVGIVLAISHHVFYSSLAGTAASSSDYEVLGTSITQQQLNIAGGTAFAFLVKASFATALGTAYIQLFWREMAHRSREVTFASLDTTFSALTNIFVLARGWVWWQYPILFAVALTCWLLPLAAIIPPATLSVASRAVSPPHVSLQEVPQVEFVSLNIAGAMTPPGVDEEATAGPNIPVIYSYQGPSIIVQNLVQAVAAEGKMLPLSVPWPNSTWSLEFPGPALQCKSVSDSFRSKIVANIKGATGTKTTSCNAYGFLAWTSLNPTLGNLEEPLPFTESGNGSYSLNTGSFNQYEDGPPTIYLAAMPAMMNTWLAGDHPATYACSSTETLFDSSSMIQCSLFNATYHADFNFVNGDQTIHTTTTPIDEPPFAPVAYAWGPSLQPSEGSRMISPGCSPLHGQYGPRCFFNETILRKVSYQAVMQAFNELIVGSVYAPQGSVSPVANSRVMNTVLTNTRELHYLTESIVITSTSQPLSLQAAVLAANGSLFKGIVDSTSTVTDVPLTEAMELLFRKITISLMSSKTLQPTTRSAFGPSLVNVTFNDYHNVYVYSAAKLWIAYAVAIGLALLFSLLGLIAIAANKATYSTNFSSVFRAAWGATISKSINDEDAVGRDPLPAYLSDTRVRFDGQRNVRVRGSIKATTDTASIQKASAPHPQYQTIRPRDSDRDSDHDQSWVV